jgi:hypothetical protein
MALGADIILSSDIKDVFSKLIFSLLKFSNLIDTFLTLRLFPYGKLLLIISITLLLIMGKDFGSTDINIKK